MKIMNEEVRINWYRCKVDRRLMSELMRKSDARAFAQVLPQLGLYAVTATLAWLAFRHVSAANWAWSVPLLLLALFVHGTFTRFFGGTACHELSHKTPFRTPFWNDFFLAVYAFLSWFDPVAYRVSHVKHHQVTVHHDLDGEVVLPTGLDWHGVRFVLAALTLNPTYPFRIVWNWICAAAGDPGKSTFFSADWIGRILPKSNAVLRRSHRNWARFMLGGHLALAVLFVATGHWFLIAIITCGGLYCPWLQLLCGGPQHAGLLPDTPDFRLCCRTYTTNRFIGFLYWNMQYHIEHHMFPAVPFYHLPRLHEAIRHDLPPTPRGLWATWKEVGAILKKQRVDPAYAFVPPLPAAGAVAG